MYAPSPVVTSTAPTTCLRSWLTVAYRYTTR